MFSKSKVARKQHFLLNSLHNFKFWFLPNYKTQSHEILIQKTSYIVFSWGKNITLKNKLVFAQYRFFLCQMRLKTLYGKEKKQTVCFAVFCFTMGLSYRKSMTVWKLCKISSNCDVAGHCSFIRLEMANVWRKISLIEKSANFIFFPMSNFRVAVFVNDAAQDCLSYFLSMSKLKSFKFSLKWRQKQISNSMRLIFMLE